MRKYLYTLLLLLIAGTAMANHLKGGFFTYKYLGPGAAPNTVRYNITLVLYMDCEARDGGSQSQVDPRLNFTIYDAGTLQWIDDLGVDISNRGSLTRTEDDECITGDQRGCYYKVITYTAASVELKTNAEGYIVSYQRCCRIGGIDNIAFSNQVGNTYSIRIPGGANRTNNSAEFEMNDTEVVCRGSYFTFPFAAKDADGDQLEYYFCDAWEGGTTNDPAPPRAPKPPYSTVSYTQGYSGQQPMGPRVTIDRQTGIVSGYAPSNIDRGEFVVTVCVDERRNGVVVATTRKELHIKVGNCAPVKPTLDPEYITCDGFTLTFANKTHTPEIKTYYWDFGVSPGESDVSTEQSPTFTFPAAGEYELKSVVNRGLLCSDSTTAIVKVFPGFVPNFGYSACDNNPTFFIDSSFTRYGSINSWNWDFGEDTKTDDTARTQHPTYTYPGGGKKTVKLTITNTIGCVASVSKEVTIIDKPFAGRDTAVVVGQPLQFEASGGTFYRWSPALDLSDPNVFNPIGVYDGRYDSIRYTVYVSNEIGCMDSATVAVRIFNTSPQVFVPTAFTPNGDGKNDLFRPIPVGMTQIEYFRVYNRWGQLVFTSRGKDSAWNGKINGKEQASGTYVWLVKGTDYTGKVFFAKGHVTLIR